MDEQQYPMIGFGLVYGERLVYCEVVMKDDEYDVVFDGKSIATISHNDEGTWMQASGVILPNNTIMEIGLKIESHYQ